VRWRCSACPAALSQLSQCAFAPEGRCCSKPYTAQQQGQPPQPQRSAQRRQQHVSAGRPTCCAVVIRLLANQYSVRPEGTLSEKEPEGGQKDARCFLRGRRVQCAAARGMRSSLGLCRAWARWAGGMLGQASPVQRLPCPHYRKPGCSRANHEGKTAGSATHCSPIIRGRNLRMAAVCCCAGSLLWGGEMTFCEMYCRQGRRAGAGSC